MRVITISREFGSGGREIGKKLADKLGFAYYDREIVKEIAKRMELDVSFTESISERGLPEFNLHFGNTFGLYYNNDLIDILVEQQKLLKQLAKKGDCVIVGRGSDVILKDFKPFRLFVTAEEPFKVAHCRKKNYLGNDLSYKAIAKKLKKIDSGRRRLHEQLSGKGWGNASSYDLCVNTTNCDIDKLVDSIKEIAKNFFEKQA